MSLKVTFILALLLGGFFILPVLAEQSYPGRPTDAELLRLMKRPCLETLEKIDYVRIDAANFEREVIKTKKAVMVLFISDTPEKAGKNASRGMTVLARTLKTVHPRLKLAVWMVNDRGTVSSKEFKFFQEKYGLRNIPCLRFYDDAEGVGYNQMRITEIDSGITWDGDLLLKVDYYAREYVPDTILYTLDR
jgi:hypothetical protein